MIKLTNLLFERKESNIKVFLGGTCNKSKWRNELISKLKIKYFNPAVENWDKEAKRNEIKERKNCDFVLYVITPKMTGLYSIAEVVEDAIKQPNKTLFCYTEQDGNKKFNEQQLNSLKEISNMIKRNKGKIFNNLEEIADYLNKKR